MSKNKRFPSIDLKEMNIEIETNIEEISDVRNLICNNEELINDNQPYTFVSVQENLTEEEFFNIVSAGKRGCKKGAGLYQQSLFGRYLEAKKEQDRGYIKDIFKKAQVLSENMKRIENLKKNKAFMKEWRKNFGKIKPESILKNTGEMRSINTIENLSM